MIENTTEWPEMNHKTQRTSIDKQNQIGLVKDTFIYVLNIDFVTCRPIV